MASDLRTASHPPNEDEYKRTRATPLEIMEWTSPHSLSQETQGRIYDLLKHAEQDLKTLDREIWRVSHVGLGGQGITLLLERREEEIRYIKVLRGAKEPLSRISPEVLGQIFAHYVDAGVTIPPTPPTSPWTLGQVSSYWRKVSRSTPDVWKNLTVRPPGLTKVSSGNLDMQAIENLLRIRAMVSDIANRSGTTRFVTVENLDGTPIIDLIIPLSKQVQSLALNRLSPSIFFSLLELPAGSWGCLETITLEMRGNSISHPPAQRSSLQAAPNLKDVHIALKTRTLSLERFLPPISLLPWSQLSRLKLSGLSIPWETTHQILAQCTGMSYCHLSISPNRSAVPASTSITLTKLESFEVSQDHSIDWTGFFRPFVFPALKRLTIMPGTRIHPDHNMIFADPMISLQGIPLLILRSNCRLEKLVVGGDPRQNVTLSLPIINLDIESILNYSPTLQTLIGPFILPPTVFSSMRTNSLELPLLESVAIILQSRGFHRFLDFLDSHIVYHPENRAHTYNGSIKYAVIYCCSSPRILAAQERYSRRSWLYRMVGIGLVVHVENRNEGISDDSEDEFEDSDGGAGVGGVGGGFYDQDDSENGNRYNDGSNEGPDRQAKWLPNYIGQLFSGIV